MPLEGGWCRCTTPFGAMAGGLPGPSTMQSGLAGFMDGGLPPEQMEQLRNCKIIPKLKTGDIHSITKANVEELVEVLVSNAYSDAKEGQVSTKDLLHIRCIPDLAEQLSEEDIAALLKDADKDRSGLVSIDELFKALTQGELAFNVLKKDLKKTKNSTRKAECEIKELLGFMQDEYETTTSLFSLPSTFCLFVSFFICVSVHFNVRNAFMMQEAIQGSIEGEGKPYLQEYVHDIRSFWEWMESSGCSVLFKNELEQWPYPGRMESYNQIIGGVQFIKKDVPARGECDQSEALRSFYSSSDSLCHMGSAEHTSKFLLYHQRVEELVEMVTEIKDDHWLSQRTSEFVMRILFYNAYLRMFTTMDMKATFEYDGEGKRDGLLDIRFDMESFVADPYFGWWMLGFDISFCFLLGRMLFDELGELFPALQSGCDGFMNYWEFWNIVDWIAIIVGTVVAGMWGEIVVHVGSDLQDSISELPTAVLDAQVLTNRTYFTHDALEYVVPFETVHRQIMDVHDSAISIATKHRQLRYVVVFYSLALMVKFFKAFRANPRLNIVIKTITEASTDLAHFIIVFLTIFGCFSLMGSVAFGARILAFSSAERSAMISWRILMGEDITEDMEQVSRFLTYMWVVGFQSIVLLTLLNMLLAIIMDTYNQVKASEVDPDTVWKQAAEAVLNKRKTSGFIDMYKLIIRLTDEDYPAHKGSTVTIRSLRRAFQKEKMTRANADYLIDKTLAWLKAKEGVIDLSLSDAVRVIGVVRNTVMRILSEAELCNETLREMRNGPMQARMDSLMRGIDPDDLKGNSGGVPGRQQLAIGAPVTMGGPSMAMLPAPQQDPQATLGNAAVSGMRQLGNGGIGDGMPPRHSEINNSALALSNGPASRASVSASGGAPMPSKARDQQTAAALEEVNSQLVHMTAMMEMMRSKMLEQEDAAKQRQEWQERKFAAFEKRLDRVERTSDQLRSAFQGFHFEELMDVPRQMEKAARQMAARMQEFAAVSDRVAQRQHMPGNIDPRESLPPRTLAARMQEVTDACDRERQRLHMPGNIDPRESLSPEASETDGHSRPVSPSFFAHGRGSHRQVEEDALAISPEDNSSGIRMSPQRRAHLRLEKVEADVQVLISKADEATDVRNLTLRLVRELQKKSLMDAPSPPAQQEDTRRGVGGQARRATVRSTSNQPPGSSQRNALRESGAEVVRGSKSSADSGHSGNISIHPAQPSIGFDGPELSLPGAGLPSSTL